jgi:hypothetical protein
MLFSTSACGLYSILPGDITYHDNYSSYANETQLKTHFLNDSPTNANRFASQMFSCTRCQRKYKFRKTLNRHMNYECGKDKSHTCSECNYRTYRNDRLMSHVRIVHPEMAPTSKRGTPGKLPKIAKIESIAYRNF